MDSSDKHGSSGTDAGTKARRWLSAALFPVSAGAVVAEITAVLALVLESRHLAGYLGIWVGLGAVAATAAFQIYTHHKQ